MFKNKVFTFGLFTAVGIVTAVLFLVGGSVLDAVAAYSAKGKENTGNIATYPHLAQNLQADLNSAMTPEFAFNFDSAGNPFADKTGLSNAEKDVHITSANTINVAKGVGGAAQNGTIFNQSGKGGIKPNAGAIMPNYPLPAVNTSATVKSSSSSNQSNAAGLLAERNRLIRQGKEVPELSTIYSVDEVRPIGIIGSGSHNKIWLYAPLTKQTFTVSRGARFRDGAIENVSTEGVEFRRDSGLTQTSRWMKGSEKTPVGETNADAPVLRVKNGANSYPQSARNEESPKPQN